MNRLFFAAFLLSGFTLQAQVNPNQFGSGKIESGNQIATGVYTDYENTPFIPTEWTKGYVKAAQGKAKAQETEKLRYNADKDRVEFSEGDAIYEIKFPVREFILGDSTLASARRFRNGFAAVDQQTPASFYEVLYQGKNTLLKRIKANLLDVTTYNSATKNKRFDINESYYVAKADGFPLRVKRDKKSILEALSNHSAQLEDYISKQKLKINSWDAVIQLLKYNESL